jgi:hypothetical protein
MVDAADADAARTTIPVAAAARKHQGDRDAQSIKSDGGNGDVSHAEG